MRPYPTVKLVTRCGCSKIIRNPGNGFRISVALRTDVDPHVYFSDVALDTKFPLPTREFEFIGKLCPETDLPIYQEKEWR